MFPLHSFSHDASITAQFLKDNVCPELDVDLSTIESAMTAYSDILKHAASQGWGVAELVQYLNTKGIDNDEITTMWAKIWKNEESKVSACLKIFISPCLLLCYILSSPTSDMISKYLTHPPGSQPADWTVHME